MEPEINMQEFLSDTEKGLGAKGVHNISTN